MIRSAEVILWGSRIGIVYQKEDADAFYFEYDRDFLQSGIEVAPFMMPLSERIFSFPELMRSDAFHGMPGLLADSLPDRFGNAVINQWLLGQGREADSLTAIERLCYTGSRGMGALEYVPANGPADTTGEVDLSEMVRLASDVLKGRQEAVARADETSKLQLLEIGSSAGGARAKAVIAWNQETGDVRSGQVDAGDGFTYWIIKFDGVSGNGDHEVEDPRQYTRIEYAYSLMAKDLSIDMEECRLLEKDGLSHFMTRRFDRPAGQKLHMQTLAALGHFDFNVPGICSYTQYADYARRLGIGRSGIEEIFRRMVFGDLSRNYDDHVKNFAFLMNKEGVWSLAPAYDLCYAYKPGNRWILGHQMLINGKRSGVTEEDLLAEGKAMGLGTRFCNTIIAEVKNVLHNWLKYAEEAGIREERADEIGKMIS